MSLSCSLLFTDGVTIEAATVHAVNTYRPPFACIELADAGQRRDSVTLHFYTVEQIGQLVAALNGLAIDLGNALADPAVVPLEANPTEPITDEMPSLEPESNPLLET